MGGFGGNRREGDDEERRWRKETATRGLKGNIGEAINARRGGEGK